MKIVYFANAANPVFLFNVLFALDLFANEKYMDTVIQLRPEELTESFYQQLQHLAAVANGIEKRISGMNAVNNLSESEITDRLVKLSTMKTVSFTMPEFESFVHQIAGRIA